MEQRNFEQAADIHYGHPPRTSSPLVNLLLCLVCLFALGLIALGLVRNWAMLTTVSTGIAEAFIILVCFLIPLLVLFALAYAGFNVAMWVIDRLDARHERREALRRENERHTTQLEIARRHIPMDERGNAAILQDGHVMQLSGNYSPYPLLTTLHQSHKGENVKGEHLLASSGTSAEKQIAAPTIAELVAQVSRNSLETGLGRSLQTGGYLLASINNSHIKLIGGTRMGKSCGAGSILEQMRQTHDPDRLQFALLDLEDKTSRLFAHDPHVLTLDTGYKRMKMHARNPEQVAQALILLHELMVTRYQMTDSELAKQPHILAYIEEFLYWKRILANLVSAEVAEQALIAFTGLATRGIKAGLHLMVCAQVDYRDSELVDAMAQFIGVNMSFAVKPDAARAAGFVSSELLKQNYEARRPGQFVVEQVGGADLGIAPLFDVKQQLHLLDGPRTVVTEEVESIAEVATSAETQSKPTRNPVRKALEPALQVKLAQMMENTGESMAETAKRVWGATPGDNAKYRKFKEEYQLIQNYLYSLAMAECEEGVND